MTNNTRKYKIIDLLGTYLDYMIDFPTCIDTYEALSIDNIFSTEVKIEILLMNYIIMDYPTMTL
jgi:hypothetical protein